MLFILAWLLWLYQGDQRGDGDGNEEDVKVISQSQNHSQNLDFKPGAPLDLDGYFEEVSRVTTSETSEEVLFIDNSRDHLVNGHLYSTPLRPKTIGEELISETNVANDECSYNVFEEWDDGPVLYKDYTEDSSVRKAKLMTQESIKKDQAEEVSFGNEEAFEQDFIVKTAKISSQPSIKRSRAADVSLENTAFKPVNGSQMNDSREPNGHNTTMLLNVNTNGNSEGRERKLSESNIILKPPPVTINIEVSSDAEQEDAEVASAFSSAEPEDMKYKPKNGTLVTVTNQPTGRIHSITVTDGQHETKPTRIRCSSPRVRAVSPRIHTTEKPPASPGVISMSQQPSVEHSVHLVVNTRPSGSVSSEDDVTSHRMVVEEEFTVKPTEDLESGNPIYKTVELKSDEGVRTIKDPNFLENHPAKPTDFDVIMNRRKQHVDTMDNVGRLLGQFGHRDEKIKGGDRVLSKHWTKVKDAVRKRRYLQFKDIPMN